MISEHYYHHLLVLGAIFFSHDKNQGRSPGNNTGTMPRFEGPAIIHQEMDLPGNSGPDFMAVVGKIGHEFHNWTFFEALPVATPWPGIMICRCSQVEVAKERALRLGWSLGSEQFQSTMSFLSIFLEAGRYPHSVRLPGGGSKGYIFGIFPALRSQNK